MKILKIGLGLLVGAFVVIFVSQIVASESAEVVVLTSNDSGGEQTTRLWVVDHEGLQYLRAQQDSGWYGRLVEEPGVRLERAAVIMSYRAEARRDLAAEVNGLMRQKYGWRDVYMEWLIGGRDDAIAVALIPAG